MKEPWEIFLDEWSLRFAKIKAAESVPEDEAIQHYVEVRRAVVEELVHNQAWDVHEAFVVVKKLHEAFLEWLRTTDDRSDLFSARDKLRGAWTGLQLKGYGRTPRR